MQKIICDRCGKEIDEVFGAEIKIPDYDVLDLFGASYWEKYDFCRDCTKKLKNWLESKEE